MSRSRRFLLPAILLAVTTAWAADDYARYSNARFGFSLLYPTFLIAARPPDNGDGQRWFSRDGKIDLIASASNNVDDETLADWYREELRQMRKVGIEPDYKVLRDTFCVISYEEDGTIFYQRVASSREVARNDQVPARFAGLVLQYDDYHRARMDKAVTKISRSLTRPRGD